MYITIFLAGSVNEELFGDSEWSRALMVGNSMVIVGATMSIRYMKSAGSM